MNKENYKLSAEITKLANRGARKSIETAKRAGIANPFVIDGKLMYKLPNGKITEKLKKSEKMIY